MLLSIHMNEYRSRKESGPQVFTGKIRRKAGRWSVSCRMR